MNLFNKTLSPQIDREIVQGIIHDDVIKGKHFPRYWPFERGINRSPVNSPRKDQWRGALLFSLICAWINAWVNNREVGGLRRHRVHYYVTVMLKTKPRILSRALWDFASYCYDKKITLRYREFSLQRANRNQITMLFLWGLNSIRSPSRGGPIEMIKCNKG